MSPYWFQLIALNTLPNIVLKSAERPQIIFKHSTRCSISTMVLNRLLALKSDCYSVADFYYLDLLSHPDISAAIADSFDVIHESPQIIVVHNGEAIYDASHNEINTQDLNAVMNNLRR